jgi:hypothetical protein
MAHAVAHDPIAACHVGRAHFAGAATVIQFENISGRRGPGGSGTSPTAYGAHDTHRAELIQLADNFPPRRLNSDRRLTDADPLFIHAGDALAEFNQTGFDYREFCAGLLFFLVVTAPAFFVSAAVVIYALLIA